MTDAPGAAAPVRTDWRDAFVTGDSSELDPARLDALFLPAATRWVEAFRVEDRGDADCGGDGPARRDPRLPVWRETGKVLPEPDRPWYRRTSALWAEGRRIRRLRVIGEPPSEGQLFLRAVAAGGNVPFGREAVRELPRGRALAAGVCGPDTWLFDGPSPLLVTLRFDRDGELVGLTASRAAADIEAARARRRAAWHAAAGLPVA